MWSTRPPGRLRRMSTSPAARTACGGSGGRGPSGSRWPTTSTRPRARSSGCWPRCSPRTDRAPRMDRFATPAIELARLIRARELSAAELLTAVLARIASANPAVNAIVTLAAEQAQAAAAALDARAARGEFAGPLHGLPIAVKDLAETAGIRTTYGSPLFASYVPDFDAPHVARLKQAGAVVIGKTNTPEFGAGSQTFNRLFGPTRNPHDTRLTPGGSRGGAAAAVAAG